MHNTRLPARARVHTHTPFFVNRIFGTKVLVSLMSALVGGCVEQTRARERESMCVVGGRGACVCVCACVRVCAYTCLWRAYEGQRQDRESVKVKLFQGTCVQTADLVTLKHPKTQNLAFLPVLKPLLPALNSLSCTRD